MDVGLVGKREWTAHQRAGWVVLLLKQGDKLTTAEIAQLTGLTYSGAYYMMEALLLLPWHLWQDEKGRWQLGDLQPD